VADSQRYLLITCHDHETSRAGPPLSIIKLTKETGSCQAGGVSQACPPQSFRTLPAPAQAAAGALCDEVRAAFGTALHALYLYGAVTFPESEGTGDLDYHAILTGPPDAGQRAGYAAACTRLTGLPGCEDLDGWVIELAQAAGSIPPVHLILTGLRDDAWGLHRAHWLAGQCVVLHGPPPAAIVPAPGWDELRQGLAAEFRFAEAGSNDAYAVLNCCRILRSLADHDVVQSKFGSGWWALGQFPAQHAATITAAMNTYRGCANDDDVAALAAGRRDIEDLAGAALR
jgi:hypothetical protein